MKNMFKSRDEILKKIRASTQPNKQEIPQEDLDLMNLERDRMRNQRK